MEFKVGKNTMNELLEALRNYELREFDETKTRSVRDIPCVISLAYTTTESGKHEVQVDFNLLEMQFEEYIDYKLISKSHLETIEEFIDILNNCTFDELVSDVLWTAEEMERNESKMELEDFTKERLCELLTWAVHGLIEDDYESAMEYFREEMDMTDEELEFFGVYDGCASIEEIVDIENE